MALITFRPRPARRPPPAADCAILRMMSASSSLFTYPVRMTDVADAGDDLDAGRRDGPLDHLPEQVVVRLDDHVVDIRLAVARR